MKIFLTPIGANYNSLRLALIPVLGCVLVVVVFWPEPNSATTLVLSTTAVSRSPASLATESAECHWPTVDIEEIVSFDPFSPFDPRGSQIPPDKLSVNSGEEAKAQQAISANLTNPTAWGKLQAIISDERGAAAIFDSRVIHVGDQLPGGGRVVAINAREIVVANE
jgi:hypothetical protein